MLRVFVDADEKRMTIHRRETCERVDKKANHDTLTLDTESMSSALRTLRGGHFDGKSFWLNIDFNDPVFEHAVVDHVRTILAPDNKAFSYGRTIGWHC